ncbi:ribonuclease H family protein [Vibrio alfacsensis]|uniref:ribonuclease H family protein n=1 Tax=Vibrio alfacsensis TaxID=1074311 RepID=UPI0040690E14
MAKSKAKAAHVVVQGHQPGVYTKWNDAEKQIDKYNGKVNWGCKSLAEAEADFKAICDWRALSPENAREMLTHDKARGIVVLMRKNPSFFKKEQVIESGQCNQPREVVLSCHAGIASAETTITSSDSITRTVVTSFGASGIRKPLEIAFSALQWSDELIEQGIDVVNIQGLDSTVISHLTNFAPKSRERDWVNASGKPFANRDVVEPMLVLYEKLGDKVTLNANELVDDTAPF